MTTVRVLPPAIGGAATCGGGSTYPAAQAGASVVMAGGRTYAASPGMVLDVPDFDAQMLRAQGWSAVCFGIWTLVQGGSGPTAQRPANPPVENHYFDTTLGKLVVWDGANWRDPGTGNTA